MQRMIESTLINNLLTKYQSRFDECQSQWDKDYEKLKYAKDTSDILKDIDILNVQLGAYECIVKDLKELIK